MKRLILVVGVLILALTAGAVVGVVMGPARLSISQLLSATLSGDNHTAHVLVWDLRLPRVVAAMLAGGSLGMAGCLLQSSTRNPLGDPQLFGLGGGAAVVQALAMAGLVGVGGWGLISVSVAASLIGAAVILVFASREGTSTARLALIGISLSALTAAAVTGILAQARILSLQPLNFVGGSLANVGWEDVLPGVPFFAAGAIMALPVVENLTALSLGDRVAANLGVEPGRTPCRGHRRLGRARRNRGGRCRPDRFRGIAGPSFRPAAGGP